MEIRPHLESCLLIMSPPASETRQAPCARVSLVHETPSHTSRTPIQIFVAAPNCKIGAPIVQPQRNVPRGVGEIESNDAAFLVPRSGDASNIECLTGDVIHPAKQNDGDRMPFAVDEQIDIFLAHAGFAGTRLQLHQRRCRIKTMKANLRLQRVLIGRKRSSLHQNLVASCRRPIERRHHEVQVYRQRIHYDDFRRICPHQLRSLLRQQSVIREPRILPSEVALNAQFRPIPEFLLQVRRYAFGLKSEGMPAEIDALLSVWYFRNVKPVAEMCERIARIHFAREFLVALI